MSPTVTVTNPPPAAALPPLPGPGRVDLAHLPVTTEGTNPMSVLINPDCRDGKHRSCSGDGLCEATGKATPCPCDCHQPLAVAMQAKHLSGASVGKLVEYSSGRSLVTNEHLWSPAATLDIVNHSANATEIHIDYGDESDITNDAGWTSDQITLAPTDWVRVTRVPA